MKLTLKTILLFVYLFVISLPAYSQDLKPVKEINNVFVERKADWARAKKMGFSIYSGKVSINFSGDKLTINNGKNSEDYALEQPVNDHSEQECWDYISAKVGAHVKFLPGDPAKVAGVAIVRRGDLSTLHANFDKTADGKMDYEDKVFSLTINDKGGLAVLRTSEKTGIKELFKTEASDGYVAGSSSLLTIERVALVWNFYLNDKLVFTFNDNSYGGLSNIQYIAGAGAKAIFEVPSIIYYNSAGVAYQRITSGITTYVDYQCGFKILEGNIEKQCPTAELNTENVRYYSINCYKEDGYFRYGVLFFKKGSGMANPLSDFVTTYLKDLYGADFDEAAFKAKKEALEKDNGPRLVEQLKADFTKGTPAATNVQFSEVKDLTIGNNAGHYLDITFDYKGVKSIQRRFYTYAANGLMLVQFDAPADALDNNSVYQAVVKNIYTF